MKPAPAIFSLSFRTSGLVQGLNKASWGISILSSDVVAHHNDTKILILEGWNDFFIFEKSFF